MKIYFLLLVVIFATIVYAEDPTSTKKIVPTADLPVPSPGVVCPMSLCPSASLLSKREDIPCPNNCPDNCRIIEDVCCPGNLKAVCNSSSSGASNNTIAPTPTPVASNSANSTVTPTPSPTSESSASTFVAVLYTCMLAAFFTVGVNQL